MFYVNFYLLILICIAGENKLGSHNFNHSIKKCGWINFSKLQFITNEFTVNGLETPHRFIKTKTNYKIGTLCLGIGNEDDRDEGKEWWMLPQSFNPRILNTNDKITFIENVTDYPT